MQKSTNLSIPKPCTEKWGSFTPTSNGGFCSTCSKVVVDFTSMSDDEIVDFFKNKPAHACGRFRADQLKSYLHRPSVKINPGITLLKTGFLSLLFLLISKPGSAQNTTGKPKTEVVDQTDDTKGVPASMENEGIIKGIVSSSEDGSALPGVNVLLKGSVIGTVTDYNGQFEFPQKLKEGDVLVFTFIGLQTVEYTVRKQDKEKMEIKMITMYLDMMGEIVVGQVYTPKESVFRKLWWKVKTSF